MTATKEDGDGMPDTLIMEPSQCLAVSSILGPKPGSVSSRSFSPLMSEYSRKRTLSETDVSVSEGNDTADLQNREAHSQTEKRRRDKMNTLIEELSAMIPQCEPLPRKLDKLTVLRLAVQHLKSLKGSSSSFSEESFRPSFLKEDELRQLILKAADGFLFVVGCDRGKILFVSESVSKTLKYSQADLIGQSLFDYLHPKDVAKVKEQLSSSDTTPREKLIDAKTGLQVHTHFQAGSYCLHWGSRRSFFCRMRTGHVSNKEKEEFLHRAKKKEHRRYCTIHCTGYLRNCPSSEVGMKEDSDSEKESYNLSCLVAIGRLHPYIMPQSTADIRVKPAEFVTRYTMDGKFVYVDQRATAILGYLPQELLGTSCYEYFHLDDHNHLTEQHKSVLQTKEKIMTNPYKFRVKDGSFIVLRSQWFSFINPWTKELEYIVSVNTVLSGQGSSLETASLPGSSHSSEDTSKRPYLNVPGISSGTLLGAANIGKEIAKQILELQRLNSPTFNGNISPTDLLKKSPLGLGAASGEVLKDELVRLSPSEIEKLDASSQNDVLPSFPIPDNLLSDGSTLDFDNDETTVAALMNFFEADGGLGDNGDLNDMHWTL
ncbi:PREDICTED: aryl hydrocarbon receptor nuclear translocator-like protein 2 [Nanorana parkeri]|uniref:aryl hydrocarbon receptor nuclear translocator-like protein 2 n=1 Tax=Nanorana parkeri TaxID=125878 RepID=UPI00085477B5|nr:PREDICTED: aryl hydrocarbon receptor nuclear translocator-like protein 2 [Nanorana parkeri]